jgi:hypothetical protein
MRIPASWLIAGALAIGLTSCGGEDAGTSSSPSPSPSANTSASPSASPAAASSFSSGTVVAQKGKDGKPIKGKDGKDAKGKDGKSKDPNSIPGLVQSTDPSERAKLVQSSIKSERTDRIDPFSSLPPLIAFSTPRVAGTGLSSKDGTGDKNSAVPELPKFPEIKFAEPPSGSGRTPSSPNFPSAPRNPSRPASVPLSPPKTPAGIPEMPPIPQPTLARQVEVTGVVKIGGTVQAIVKAPNEPTSRYVGIGQKLSNGQILVKRIELNPGSDPVVILEENGIEVRVEIGSGKKKTP